MKNTARKAICILLLLTLSSCFYGVRRDGPYMGRVVDAETREPIEGVVVLGVWNTETPTPAGALSKYYDATETVTDQNGDFLIPGLGTTWGNVEPMHFLIFKSGYEHIGMGLWTSLKRDIILRNIITWEGERAIIPLKKLTMEERKKVSMSIPSRPSIPITKMKLMTQEIDKERIEQGLKPLEMR